MNSYAILKEAFIDAEISGYSIAHHDFSESFELSMDKIIKQQKCGLRFINSTGKRVACVLLAILLSFATVSCSIKEVREPIIEEIQSFFVNAKELLNNTAADDVADLFPTDVTKIIGTSFISKSNRQYIIDEQNEVTDFIKLLSTTYWGEPEWFDEFSTVNTYWTFDFYDKDDKTLFQIKMCNDAAYDRSKIAIIKDGAEKHFYISNKVYREILAFTNEKYYLHNSPIKNPDKDYFTAQRKKVSENLTEYDLNKINKCIRNVHYEIEIFLLREVSNLKEKDSVYWDYVISEEIFTDPISNYDRKYDINRIMNHELEYIISTVSDENARAKLKKALDIWNESVKSHDLGGLFTAHEYLHDFDYFAFNYPTRYVYTEFADYQGLDDYFGRIE